ncbi:MAG: MATE family efflux transporter [Acidobacteriota bacterium]|nr:MATE family efflux transporter [Acidobacteriota bacterium]
MLEGKRSSDSQPPAIVPAGHAGFWAAVRDSIRGVRMDYTSVPIGRAILLLAVPMVLEMSMQSLFSVVDVYFVGKLGSDAVAVVGISDSLLTLVFAIAIGLSMGTTAMVARRIGEQDPDAASVAAQQAIALGIAVAVPLGILGILFSERLLLWMGMVPATAEYGSAFTAILLGGNATVMLLFLINAVFRGAGDPAIAMRALWIANGLNILLDPILIFGWGPIPALGLEGAAIATTVGRGIGVLYQFRMLGRPQSHVRVDWRRIRVVQAIMARLARVSGIGILQYLVGTASFLGLVRIVALFGADALAGYTIAVRVIIFVLLPAWGMGNAAATLVRQNLGAGDTARAEKSVWLTALCNSLFLGGVAVILVFFARPLVGFFSNDPAVTRIATESLRIISYSYVFWGYGMITVLAFNGAGDTTTPTWINFFVYWVVQLPLAYFLSVPLGWGPQGAFVAVAVSQATLAVVGVLAFRRGTWKTRDI